jgi:hypothetical protein
MNAYFQAERFENMESQHSEFRLQYSIIQQNIRTSNNNSLDNSGNLQLRT